MWLKRLNALLVQRTGQALSMNMQARLDQSLNVQAAALGCDVEAYLQRLEAPRTDADRQALQSLINLNTVGKTLLWRYPEQLALITEVLLPELDRSLPSSAPINIWSAACSTGEEVYSILLSLALGGALDAGRRPLHVVASDINTDSLALARSGLLHDLRSRALPAECAPYLQRRGEALEEIYVHESIRQRVRFVQANLTDRRSYPQVVGGWHLVICANVLFYFDRTCAQQVLQGLAQAMAPRSALLLGGAETLQNEATPFGVARWRDSFAYVRGDWDPGLAPLPKAPAPVPVHEPMPVSKTPVSSAGFVEPLPLTVPPIAWDAALAGDWQACVEVCRQVDLSAVHIEADACCRVGLLALRHGHVSEAVVALAAAADKDRFAFYTHYYLGLAHAQQAQPHDAIAALRKALFLQPQNPAVRYEFALQLLRTGDAARASEALRQCIQGLHDGPLDRGPHGYLIVHTWMHAAPGGSDAAALRQAAEGFLARLTGVHSV